MGSMMLPKYKGSASSISTGDLPPDIAKFGYLRKLKTMKKKYIVLRTDSDAGAARLEYYDSEKKCRNGQAPKRSIVLKNCFNINRKMDSKHKFALALYTRDDCFALVAESEAEMEAWLGALLKLQQGDANWDGDPQPKPNFEHVWQVNVKNRGLASTSNITGPHHLCLTSQTLSLVKMSSDKDSPLQFPLISIRRCGHSDCFFFMELGRSAVTGCGELWMATEDNIIAQNMHETILGAMMSSRNNHEDLGPMNRPRSASTSDNNNSRTGVSSAPRPVALVNPLATPSGSVVSITAPFRSRTVSEGHHDLKAMRENMIDPLRPHSTAYSHSVSYSPPMTTKPLSPGSSVYSDSAGSSHSIDDYDSDYHPNRVYVYQQEGSLHTEPTITEEPTDDYLPMSPGDFEPLNLLPSSDMSPASLNESSALDYMQMNCGGGNSTYSHTRNSGIDSMNKKQMFLSLNSQLPDSCTTSPTTDYIEMASPSSCSTHQDSAGEGYIPMSPVGSLSVDLNVSNTSTGKRSQGSLTSVEGPGGNNHLGNLPVELYSGYVPMAPVRENEGYMDMSALSSSLPKSTIPASRNSHVDLSTPSHSSHSLQDVSFGSNASGLEEYHLDKVKSYFPPSEDDGEVYIKPARAYSVGSRPQVQKSHLAAHLETSRVRAYSFGSQASSRRRETSTYVGIDAELGTPRSIVDTRNNKKSSSAPLLQSGPLQTPTSTTMPLLPNTSAGRGSSRSGVGRLSGNGHNDDLMEIVYHQQPQYLRMKPDEHSTRRYSMGTHWQRSNNRSNYEAKGNSKEDKKNRTAPEVVDQTEGSQRSKKYENEYMEIPRSSSKNGGKWEDQSDTYRSLQPSAKKVGRKLESTESFESSRSSHQVGLKGGSHNTIGESSYMWRSEDADVTAHKKTSVKPPKQKSECSDYMEMGQGSAAPFLQHASYSFDTLSSSHQNESANSAGDYVNLDMSIRQQEKPKAPSPVEIPPTLSNTDTQSRDYMNLQPGQLTSSEDANDIGPIETVAATQPRTNEAEKANSTNTMPKCVSEAPGLVKSSSSTTANKSSCRIPTANDTGNRRCHRRASASPERTSASEMEVAGSRRSLVEGPYENIQVCLVQQPSVERQLNYASLDLAPTSSSEDIVPRSPRISKVPGAESDMPLSYAEIDFTKSEGLRNTSGSLREGRV